MIADLTRRRFLGLAAGAAAVPVFGRFGGVAFGRQAAEAAKGPEIPGGFRLGVATYSFIKFPLDKALAMMNELGLVWAEVNPKHFPDFYTANVRDQAVHPADFEKSAKLGEYKALFAKAGITPWAHGVVYFSKDHGPDVQRARCAFAKAMGFRLVSVDYDPEVGDSLETIAGEHGLLLGIHNHGPGSRFDKLVSVQKALEGRKPHFGATVDVGHVLRAGENPVDWVKALGPRVHGIHLKDVMPDGKTRAIPGKGQLKLKDLLAALKEIKYPGVLSIEHEANMDDPLPEMKQYLPAVREAAQGL